MPSTQPAYPTTKPPMVQRQGELTFSNSLLTELRHYAVTAVPEPPRPQAPRDTESPAAKNYAKFEAELAQEIIRLALVNIGRMYREPVVQNAHFAPRAGTLKIKFSYKAFN